MNSLLLGMVLLGFSADPPPPVPEAAFEFQDAYDHEGRSMVFDQTIALRGKPAEKLSGEYAPAEGDLHAQLPLGNVRDDFPAVVWIPQAKDGPVLWFDANGDGRLEASERHVMKARQLEIPASITIKTKSEPKKVTRTVRFRRPLLGEGLRWTVRGYAAGKLDLGGVSYDAMIADGNANCGFGSVGRDRLWIDLNQDGRFDPLIEQFLLGKPLPLGDRIYVVRSNAAASAVVAQMREPGEGKLRLALAKGLKADTVSAELISDLGELVEITKVDQFVPVPHGQYSLASLAVKTVDSSGQPWFYTFSRRGGKRHAVPIGQETTIALLDRVSMRVGLDLNGNVAKPSQTITVRPEVATRDGALWLSACTRGSEESHNAAEGAAVILFLSPDGKQLSRGISGFG